MHRVYRDTANLALAGVSFIYVHTYRERFHLKVVGHIAGVAATSTTQVPAEN